MRHQGHDFQNGVVAEKSITDEQLIIKRAQQLAKNYCESVHLGFIDCTTEFNRLYSLIMDHYPSLSCFV